MDDVDHRLRIVEQQINTHEAVCAERYQGILNNSSQLRKDLSALTRLLIAIAIALMTGMAAILSQLIFEGK